MSLIVDDIKTEGYLSGNTFYSVDAQITNLVVTNITGASTTDYYVTGGTYSSGTLTLDRNGLSAVTITGFTTGGGGGGTLTGTGVADKVAFWTDSSGLSATTNFSWDSANERFGVGITSPTAKAHINNTGSTDSFLVEDSVNPDTSPFVIDATGRVGIGLTTPLYPLHISAAASASTNEPIVRIQMSDSSSYFAINNATTADSIFVPEVLGRGASTNTQIGAIFGAYIDSTQDSGTNPITVFRSGLSNLSGATTRPLFDFRNISTSVLTITANGNVGINDSSPDSRLTIVTTASTTGAYPANSGTLQTGDILRLRNGGSNLVLDVGGFSSNGNWLQSTNQTDLSLKYPLLLNPNGGRIGINLTSPSEALHVSGNTLIEGAFSIFTSSGVNIISGNTSTDMLRITQVGSGNALVVEDSANPDSTPFLINGLGNIAVGTTTFDGTNPEKFVVAPSNQNAIVAKGPIAGFMQLNIQNTSSATNASSDVVATNNTGNDTVNYIDMGINSSTYIGGNIGIANDAYLYNIGRELYIGNATSTGTTGNVNFFAGNLATSTIMKLTYDQKINIVSTPTLNNSNTEILTRNSSTGNIEYSNAASTAFYPYGIGFAQSIGNYLT